MIIISFMIGYIDILQASEEARGVDFSMDTEIIITRFRRNPLRRFFCLLSDFLITHSAEATEMARTKTRSRTPSPKKRTKRSHEKDDEPFLSEQEPRLPSTDAVSSAPSPSTPVANKRVFSGGSYGHSSTETTPVKINQPEPLTQSLQNELIGTLISDIWLGGAKVAWTQNRKLKLGYRPFRPQNLGSI